MATFTEAYLIPVLSAIDNCGEARFRRWTASLLLLLLCTLSAAAQDSPCNQGRALAPLVDPRSYWAICMPELGSMYGPMDSCKYANELFGLRINAVGDVNSDSLMDWCVAHYRCDTISPISGKQATEVLLYKGIRGGLPDRKSGQRIGPSELLSKTTILAAGDWDGDGNQDIATSIQILDDTSYGSGGFESGRIVIFWGNKSGEYSLADTTRLVNTVSDFWGGGIYGVSADFDRDGASDFFLFGGGGYTSAGAFVSTPQGWIFRGHKRERWGRNEISRSADWTWWNIGWTNYGIDVTDQDCDGAPDIVFYYGESAKLGRVSVLYGNPTGGLPDTNSMEYVSLDSANGYYALLSDVTGDKVPELIVNCGAQEVIKVFAGRHGMRLKEMYGNGNYDPPTPGWVSRPWATIWLPLKINDNWFQSGFDPVFDFGDADADGTNDIWAINGPYVLCYISRGWMDSLIDAIVDIRPGVTITSSAQLGDIDGSGLQTTAIGNNQSVIFVQQSPEVPHNGTLRQLPPGTASAQKCGMDADVPVGSLEDRGTFPLEASPNPSTGEVRLRWYPAGKGSSLILVDDEEGREVARYTVGPGNGEFIWQTSGWPKGAYFVTVRSSGAAASRQILLQ